MVAGTLWHLIWQFFSWLEPHIPYHIGTDHSSEYKEHVNYLVVCTSTSHIYGSLTFTTIT